VLLAVSFPLAMPDDAVAANRRELMEKKKQARWYQAQQVPTEIPQSRSVPAITTVGGEDPALTPLDRLKARSAQQRWTELNQRQPVAEPAPIRPVPEPRDIPAVDQPAQVIRPTLTGSEEPEPGSQLPPYRPDSQRFLPTGPIAGGQERAIGGTLADIGPVMEPVRDPKQLRRLTSIMPFYDYVPEGAPGYSDPCHNICPRPNEERCKNCPDGHCPQCPEEVALTTDPYVPREISHLHYCWEAADVYYNPLYFEDFQLERYGHEYPCVIQPIASVGRFAVQLLGIPYQATIHPIWECQSPLGYCRPGEFVPFKNYQIPWNTRAAAVEGAAAVGAVFFIP
jgi:hypothetical protein